MKENTMLSKSKAIACLIAGNYGVHLENPITQPAYSHESLIASAACLPSVYLHHASEEPLSSALTFSATA